MSALALDIGTFSVKAVSGKPGKKIQLEKAVEVYNGTGLALPTDDTSLEKLGLFLETFLSDNDLPRKDVRLSLPDTVASIKVISMPPLSDAELASAIGWQAEQHIPIPPDELSLEYQVLYRPNKKDKENMRVLLVGVRKQVVERYIDMFNHLGIEPTLLETQMLSVIRSLQFSHEDPTTLLAHIGHTTMQLALVRHTEPEFILTHLNGGQLLTRALEQGIGLDTNQAEQYKRTYGLDPKQFQGKVRESLLPAVKLLLAEVRKAAQFFINQHSQETIQRVVISGGSALLPDLVQHVTSELGAEVLVAAPFLGIDGEIPHSINQPAMAVCVGLLAREL